MSKLTAPQSEWLSFLHAQSAASLAAVRREVGHINRRHRRLMSAIAPANPFRELTDEARRDYLAGTITEAEYRAELRAYARIFRPETPRPAWGQGNTDEEIEMRDGAQDGYR